MIPTLSVVIPVYNDPSGVRDTLRTLINQETPTDQYEILVVDNNSTDETPSVIDEFETAHSDIVTGLEETEIQSSYATRNTGIEHASGELIGFLDADVTVEETWVDDVIDRFENTDVDYLGCNVEMYIPEGKTTFWAQYDKAMGLPVKHYLKTKQFAPTAALVVRKMVLDDVGYFDEKLKSGGDKEFGYRVHEGGFVSGYAEDIVVRHPARTTFREHVKKAARIGRGRTQLWRSQGLGPHPVSPVQLLPPSIKRIKSRMGGREPFVKVYLTAYFLKLVQTLSSIKEFLA